MKKRGSKKQKQLEARIQLVFLIFILLMYYWTKSIGTTVVLLIPLTVLIFGIFIFRNHRQKQLLRRSGIKEIDRMEGVQFEFYLKELYSSLGYSAKVTKSSGDFGADLILTKDGRKIVVQAKRYSNNVGVKAVQEIKAAQSHYSAVESWVVTNSYFTKAAIELASSNAVKLINRDQLIKDILSIKKVS